MAFLSARDGLPDPLSMREGKQVIKALGVPQRSDVGYPVPLFAPDRRGSSLLNHPAQVRHEALFCRGRPFWAAAFFMHDEG